MIREHGHERRPRPDLIAVLLGHDARDLGNVAEVVNDPARQQLAQRHRAEARMLARQVELLVGDVLRAQQCEILTA